MCGILYLHDPSGKSAGLEMAERMFLGLSNLQHRGQHGGGIGSSDGNRVWVTKFFGPVADQYDSHGARAKPPVPYRGAIGELVRRRPFKAVGHLRYATAGADNHLGSYQPHHIDPLGGRAMYAANGDIPKLIGLKETLQRQGVEFYSENDGEFTLRMIARIKERRQCSWLEAIQEFMQTVEGAYSGILMTKESTFFLRDPRGFRPFLMGTMSDGTLVAASESCALDILNATFDGEVERGMVMEVKKDGTRIPYAFHGTLPPCAHCIFCQDYFGRPDSRLFIDGRPFDQVPRKGSYAHGFGRQLAIEAPMDVDVVAPVPDSGNLAARGYCVQSGLRGADVLVRNRTVPRTFIMSVGDREMAVRMKFGVQADMLVKHPRIGIVDDSIVRGTTSRILVKMLREAGATEVHMRLSFPPVRFPCHMGIAMPTREELIASDRSVEAIRQYLGVDSLAFLSPEGIQTVMKRRNDDISNYCTACYSGNYPIPV